MLKKIILSILIIFFINISIYASDNGNWALIVKKLNKSDNCRTYSTKDEISYNDITDSRDKLWMYSMNYTIFNEFVNDPTESFLERAFINKYCDVIEYSINKNGDLRSLILNKDMYIMDEDSSILELFGTFSSCITYYQLNNFDISLQNFLLTNNIQDNIIDYAIISTNQDYYPFPLLCVFTENDAYLVP